ncbi:phosphatase PAP2 family protein [Acinetobacter stercoris]|uniref:undecaprenyl-diphosphate phosphatase n=1 Tax=Acinetobacter stercoris TaxID=2126983 RepID=A0A2U3MVL8_9GAMM|nr:phosphatase PAP2 family protein [Acinetobacter stercoris]SPL69349.1 Undecaprenyl-diphosphatase BcrC [Acinetobacter stercoris]
MLYLLILLGCIGIGISSFGLFVPYIHQLDFSSVNWLSIHRSEFINLIAMGLSTLGGLPGTLLILTIWCLHQAWYKKYVNILFISAGIIGSATIGWILKFLVNRPRPETMYQMVKVYGASFPSAHSIYAMTVACLVIFIFYKHRKAKMIILLVSIWWLSMGVSRVYLGAHFPTDVLAGWSIGLIWIATLRLWISHRKFGKNNYF